MTLLIDIGNTRIKWARDANGEVGPLSAIAHADVSVEQLHAALIANTSRAGRVAASNVAGPRVGGLVAECVRKAWGVEVEFVHSTATAGGVRNAYPEPAKLGVDRWLAIIGAHALERGHACVASVGTAMTIDAVDASGVHHGGVIVPGPDLMVTSLFRNTSDIAARAEHGESTSLLFADNTRGAVEQGAVHALAALIERALAVFEHDVGERAAVILTGGAADRVAPALNRPHRIIPDLVLRGLAVVAREKISAGGTA